MRFQNAKDFPMSKGFRRRREAHLARGRVYQIVGGERLNERGLTITTGAKYHALQGIRASTADDYINRAMPFDQPGLLKPAEVYAWSVQ